MSDSDDNNTEPSTKVFSLKDGEEVCRPEIANVADTAFDDALKDANSKPTSTTKKPSDDVISLDAYRRKKAAKTK